MWRSSVPKQVMVRRVKIVCFQAELLGSWIGNAV